MLILLHCLTLLLLLLTLASLSRRPQWWIRGLDFPRLQLLLLALILAALYLFYLSGGRGPAAPIFAALAVSIGCALDHGLRLIPYSPLGRPEVESIPRDSERPSVRIMIANVLMTNRQYARLLEQVKINDPDLVLFLEGDSEWEAALETGLQDYPHVVRCAKDNLYGMHLYSRLPLFHAEIRYRVQPGVPSIIADLKWPTGDNVLLHCVHPAPPSPTENEQSIERDAELVKVASDIGGREQPTLVIGDFNDVPWSRPTRLFRKLSGLADPRVGRGLFSTFHALIPLCRWPLDHVFCTEHFSLVSLVRSEPFGSDHFALVAELVLSQNRGEGTGALTSEAGDQDEADRIIEELDPVSVDAI